MKIYVSTFERLKGHWIWQDVELLEEVQPKRLVAEFLFLNITKMLASCQEKKFHIQKKIWPPPKKMLLDIVHPAKSNIPLYTICNLRFII